MTAQSILIRPVTIFPEFKVLWDAPDNLAAFNTFSKRESIKR